MPVPCRNCGALLDSYSDFCGCPESEEAKAAAAPEPKPPLPQENRLPRIWPDITGEEARDAEQLLTELPLALCF